MIVYGWQIRLWLVKKMYPSTPVSASLDDWDRIDLEERKYPVRYIIARVVPRWVARQHSRLMKGVFWFTYRLVPKHKYHLIRTGLKPGYYEIDTRMLYGCFSLLREYVESEIASRWTEDGLTGAAAGLSQLAWESELTYDEFESHGNPELIGLPTPQAEAAREIIELYNWWVNVRQSMLHDDMYDIDYDDYSERSAVDTAQLIRLVAVRRALWT